MKNIEQIAASGKPRITKIICCACEGSGECKLLGIRCLWCHGAKRLPVKDALRYADNAYVLAIGGYVTGDHDLADMRRLEAEAEAIYTLAGVTPAWKAAS